MRLVVDPRPIAMVRLPAGSPVPAWATGAPLASVSSTPAETSVICPTSSLPDDLPGPVEGPLVAVMIAEHLEFSQVGVIVSVLRPLADAGIPVLTVSTFDTDWVLLRAAKAAAAVSVWRAAGFDVREERLEESA